MLEHHLGADAPGFHAINTPAASCRVSTTLTCGIHFHIRQGTPEMSTQRTALEELITSLKQERDELKLKIHLAGMEGKEEYERLSGKIDELTDQYEPVKDAVQESASNVFSAFLLAAGEMKNGFHRVRKAISEE